MAHGTLFVVGSGPGIGVHVAKQFAEKGFKKVILASRDSSRLAKEVDQVKAVAGDVDVAAITLDLADKTSITTALEQADKHLADGPGLESVLFNAARLGPSKLFDFSPAELERDMHISVTGLYVVAFWAMPKLVEAAKDEHARPSFLVTSGGLAKDPFPHVFSLAMCKAAQYSLVGSLFKAYEPSGVHCGLIVVQGYVKPDAQVTTPKHIAEKTWELAMQERGSFELEVDIVDPEYKAKRKGELEKQLNESKQ